MITGHLKRPICQNGGSITRSLHGHFNQLASDIYERRISLSYLRSMRAKHPLSGQAPSRGLQPWSAAQTAEESSIRLERFQACALRNHPALHVPPERNEQAPGQGHDPNAPHALTSQSKARIEPDAEGGVGLIA
jgi:hypothetical protein